MLDEPSVVAMRGRDVVAVGAQAKEMVGRAPGDISVLRPVQHSVIHHYDATERMLRYFVQQAHGRSLLTRPRLVLSVPGHLTGVEQRAVRDAAYAAGARQVYLVPTALAAAIGADIPIHETAGHFVLSLGAGCTEVAVIALGGVVAGTSLRQGGDDLDQAVADYLVEHFDIRVGPGTAEEIKIGLGSAVPVDGLPTMTVTGQDSRSGLPKRIELSGFHVRKALQPAVDDLLVAVRRVLDETLSRSPATSCVAAWWSPAAGPCCAACRNASSTISACRCGWPARPTSVWSTGPVAALRTSRPSASCC